jgi:hypothetical protein
VVIGASVGSVIAWSLFDDHPSGRDSSLSRRNLGTGSAPIPPWRT